MKVAEARKNVGGLSNTSKIPGKSYGLPAQACKVGGQLRPVAGSTCEKCYAFDRGMYGFPVVKAAQARRLATLTRPDWSASMARAINRDKYFRWHDSGDIQNGEHFAKIVEVARATPDCLHWLPTREAQTVAAYTGDLPDNLIVRVSAAMVDGPAPKRFANTSTVHARTIPTNSHICPAPRQGNECRDCRACWDKSIPNISYHQH
tara:strand:- start:673 stop:1287 length:615 start_codon:yes stop_codon:yes gene_type:complete